MTVRPIITLPDEKILRQLSKPVKAVDVVLAEGLEDLRLEFSIDMGLVEGW